MLETTTAVILAAGQGTRMKSQLPKVLHGVAGRPLVHYPVRAALEAGCGEVVVVVGHAYLGSLPEPTRRPAGTVQPWRSSRSRGSRWYRIPCAGSGNH